jgi:hypothetical protein
VKKRLTLDSLPLCIEKERPYRTTQHPFSTKERHLLERKLLFLARTSLSSMNKPLSQTIEPQ